MGETLTPSGQWSTYPPHKHEVARGSARYSMRRCTTSAFPPRRAGGSPVTTAQSAATTKLTW
ncbi:MAG: 5-deoxy-glucuronate isomerase [Meiothermus sp.]|uniref:5-deoxy-glucuronate isomerase n=1 Tax=Meiothermus sp. TaxID=1955249 RepID=UPI00298ED1C7|nr:5-deoxy-glucuronate isomerase [Meiothermus sp.]MDW8481584.1 5-deoxy-glucuronate isomerase [Meiothermus sp.]